MIQRVISTRIPVAASVLDVKFAPGTIDLNTVTLRSGEGDLLAVRNLGSDGRLTVLSIDDQADSAPRVLMGSGTSMRLVWLRESDVPAQLSLLVQSQSVLHPHLAWWTRSDFEYLRDRWSPFDAVVESATAKPDPSEIYRDREAYAALHPGPHQYLFELDRLTKKGLLPHCPDLTDADVRVYSLVVRSAMTVLHQRLIDRHNNADPPIPQISKAVLRFVSGIFFDAAAFLDHKLIRVEGTLRDFAAGYLRYPTRDPNSLGGDADGYLVFLFAEAADLCLKRGVDAASWAPLFKTMAMMQKIFTHRWPKELERTYSLSILVMPEAPPPANTTERAEYDCKVASARNEFANRNSQPDVREAMHTVTNLYGTPLPMRDDEGSP